jgi:uncharacterized repeat protein (TIGR02543 family)
MKQFKFILPLLLTIITLSIYNLIETQATTTNYSLTYTTNVSRNADTGLIVTGSTGFHNTNLIQIQNNSFNVNDLNLIGMIFVYDSNNNYLGFHSITDPTHSQFLGTITQYQPQNGHFIIIQNRVSSYWGANGKTFTQFQTLNASYSTPVPVTTTYPNINFIDNQNIGVISGLPTQQTNFMRTDLIDITSFPTTWNLTGHYITGTYYYDQNFNYLGWQGVELVNSSNQPAPNRKGHTATTDHFDLAGVLQAQNFPTARYIAYSAIKDASVGADISNEGYTYINPYMGIGNFTNFSSLTFNTNQVLVQFGTFDGQTIFYNAWITIGTDITNLSNSLSTDPNLPREGFTFTGFSGSNIVPSTNPYLRLAQYNQLQEYTVTFLDYDNTTLGTDTVFQGQPASAPVIPTRTGYTFTGWEPPISNIQGNISTVAQYTPNQYMVTWISDGITIKSQLENHDSVFQTLAPPVTKENHVLTGWNLEGTTTPLQLDATLSGASSFEAVWEPVPTYTVVWRDVDFNTLKIEYVIESGIAVAPNYVASSGFVLVGWTPDPTQPITQNITFVAVVEAIPTTPSEPSDYSPISDLFGGVIGASIGAVMTLGTIDLYGIQLSSMIYLFISMSLGLWILKAIRG